MALYDEVELYADIHLPAYPGVLPPPDRVTWETDAVPEPRMNRFKITADGCLVETEWQFVAEDDTGEQVTYDGEDAFGHWLTGTLDRVQVGWTDRTDYTGEFPFGKWFDRLDDEVVYSARFEAGSLTAMRRVW